MRCTPPNKFLIIQHSIAVYKHNDVQQRSRTCSSCKAETLYEHNCLFPHAPGNHHLLSVSMSVTILDASSKCNHAAFVLLRLDDFTQHHVLQVHACCSVCQDFLFNGRIIFPRTYRPRFPYPFIS